MAIAHSTDKIIIIGAGPGGLVLAHCLRKHGIPYEIFEREKASQPRKQGWAVALIEYVLHLIPTVSDIDCDRSLPDLEASLPAEVFQRLPTASVNRNMDSNDIFSIIDGKTGNVTAAVGGEDYPSSRCLLRVNRQAFRQVLCEGIKVQNDKELDYYEEFEDGVVVHFKDGTSTTGSLLVGADGAHSAGTSFLSISIPSHTDNFHSSQTTLQIRKTVPKQLLPSRSRNPSKQGAIRASAQNRLCRTLLLREEPPLPHRPAQRLRRPRFSSLLLGLLYPQRHSREGMGVGAQRYQRTAPRALR